MPTLQKTHFIHVEKQCLERCSGKSAYKTAKLSENLSSIYFLSYLLCKPSIIVFIGITTTRELKKDRSNIYSNRYLTDQTYLLKAEIKAAYSFELLRTFSFCSLCFLGTLSGFGLGATKKNVAVSSTLQI